MRRICFFLFIIFMASCHSPAKGPDVSGIQVPLSTDRFEKDFFSLDTNHLMPQLEKLVARYPSFGENFLGTILNADPRWGGDTTELYIRGFISSYRSVYDSASRVFKDFSPYEQEIKKALQHVKYYFPSYPIPKKIITYIGPIDGYGDILSEDALIVGLHQHLGENFSLYRSEWVSQTYPDYLTRRFTPATITINAMKNILGDLFPEMEDDKSLVLQMIEKGKRLYILGKLLPDAEEHNLIGYTKKQLKECYEHEPQIWDLFLQNNLLRTIDNNLVKNYIGESPKTQELGDASPGNIGSFAGWQIVKKYMDKNPGLKLPDLMKTDDEQIFQQSKYKP